MCKGMFCKEFIPGGVASAFEEHVFIKKTIILILSSRHSSLWLQYVSLRHIFLYFQRQVCFLEVYACAGNMCLVVIDTGAFGAS